jgi:hypothetical protein
LVKLTNYAFEDARVETLKFNDRFSVRDNKRFGRSVMRFVKVVKVDNYPFSNTNEIHANHATMGRVVFIHNPHKMVRKVR